jgi:hypothetical protein
MPNLLFPWEQDIYIPFDSTIIVFSDGQSFLRRLGIMEQTEKVISWEERERARAQVDNVITIITEV